jgi:hypothetical protein
MTRSGKFITGMLAGLAILGISAKAHEIPNDVTIQSYIRPEGKVLQFLVRVPLAAMRDVAFPDREGGYLDLAKSAPLLSDAATLWIANYVDFYEEDVKLPKPRIVFTRLSLPGREFATWEQAIKHVQAPPLPENTNLFWNQPDMDVLFEYPINSDQAHFSIHPALGRLGLRVITVLRFMPAKGEMRVLEYSGDPGLVRLDPRWFQAAGQFIKLGFLHILDGTDHLLFLLCLVIPFRKFRSLVPVVTAFTVAHSITLIASAYDLAPSALWFPPLIEMLIAASIVYMALENITGKATIHTRWMVAFGFGLVHGFGFSFALRESLQFAGSHLLTSLLSFNVGVEMGQLLMLLIFIPALDMLFQYVTEERMGTIIVSALVAHTGWHWMMERWDKLSQFRISMPDMNAATIAALLRFLALIAGAAGLVWLVANLAERWNTRRADSAD